MNKSLGEWLAKNLWAILALIGGAAQGYNVGTGKMDQMGHDVDRITAKLNARRQFMNEATGRLEFLCNKDAECRTRFQPMQTPE